MAKKRGRPKGSKNNKSASKLKIKYKPEPLPEYSFDTEGIILMYVLGHVIRTSIEDAAVEIAKDKQCIPKDIIEKAIKKVGLGEWLEKLPDEPTVETI